MTQQRPRTVPVWLWKGMLGTLVLVLAAALVLIIALALGWNSPRPVRTPDWTSADLPLSLWAGAGETAVSLLDQPGGDRILELDAAPGGGPSFNGHGLVFRAQDPSHYYVLAIGSDGYYAVLRVEGQGETALVDWQQFPHVRRGERANRLRVACEGPTCHHYINDEYAATTGDDTWLVGDVGLWVRGYEEGTEVRFDGARAWVGGE